MGGPNRGIGFLIIICLLGSMAQAVTIPVTYIPAPSTSWVDAGVFTPIATSPVTLDDASQNINATRHNAQTFTTGATGFTLDKVWIHYQNLQSTGPGRGQGVLMELRLFTVANPSAAAFVTGTNLFALPQEHVVPATPNDNGGHFAIFDVDNLALNPNQSYAIQFVVNGFPYQWSRTTTPFLGGDGYSIVGTPPAFDHVFALQAVTAQQPPTGGAAMPEPTVISLLMGGCALMLRRRRLA